ncbi:hypothetical protein ACFZAI_25670 [Achromobacter sp. NPDC008082]|uniref:hypothetical protein n=1 Tax=Achromobacter sp. NPDC008082 TaxID=3363888 RepID=UPI0036EB0849
MRTVLRAIGFVLLALAGPPSFAADAQPAGASAASGASGARSAPAPAAAGGACIDTEVNGYRALSYDCLNQKMAPSAPVRPAPSLESEAITQRPPNQMGLPTPATIGNRMGNTFGTSAYPQRPQP